MINRVCLTGRLTKDVELMKTKSGNVVSHITLAVDRNFKKDGQQNTDFINCVAFGKQAEAMSNYLSKGSLIGIDGKLDQSTYQNREGKNVSSVSVIVQNFSFLESRHDQAKSNAYVARKKGYESNSFDEYKNSGYQGIENEDLPF